MDRKKTGWKEKPDLKKAKPGRTIAALKKRRHHPALEKPPRRPYT